VIKRIVNLSVLKIYDAVNGIVFFVMKTKLSIFILLFVVLSNSTISYSQDSLLESNSIVDRFKQNFENDQFQIILNEFEKLKSNGQLKTFTIEENATIRYLKFSSEIYLRSPSEFDNSNFSELVVLVDSMSKIEDQRNYLICINNMIQQTHMFYPEWSIKLTDIVLKIKDFSNIPDWNQIEYTLLYIQFNSYNRLRKFKEASEIKSRLDRCVINDPGKQLLSLLELAHYNMTISQYQSAHKYLTKADSLFVNTPGLSATDSVNFTILWAKFFKEQNDTINAKLYFRTALQIADFNNLTEDVCVLKFELAILENEPEKCIAQFKELTKETECKTPSLMLSIYNSLGVNYGKLGIHDTSTYYYKLVYDFEKKYLEKVASTTILNLANGYFNNGMYKQAQVYYKKAFENKNEEIKANFYFLSNVEKSTYWNNENWLFRELSYFNVYAFQTCPSTSELSFNANLISKSLLLETFQEFDKAVAQSSDINLKAQFNEMKKLRKLYITMQSVGSEKKKMMDLCKFQADSLDKILVNKLGVYAASKRKFEITWKDVQSNLTADAAAIEYARYYDKKDASYKYVALVIRPGYEYPKLIKLGTEKAIKKAIHLSEFDTLYNLVWQEIDSLLDGVKKVYYSPAGELNNVSFAALISEVHKPISEIPFDTKWAYLMDRYELHQLTTTRYLADGTLQKIKPLEPSITLVGGIDYKQLPEIQIDSEKEQSNEDYAFQLNLDAQLSQNRNMSSNISYLKGSESEVKNISTILNQSKWAISVYTGRNAGEYELKHELTKSAPSILHIATHGFAFPDLEKKKQEVIGMTQESNYKASEDPMVRCGLMLSGSNISWSGDPMKMIEQTGDDGVLTAAEVANMDLSHTKLVVLSACETGLGKIESSEGTFGLKRGFKLAGVEQIIVSLWSVPDKETSELMTLFYSDLSKSHDPVLSFNKAQKEMRILYPYEPEKWAGFVLVR